MASSNPGSDDGVGQTRSTGRSFVSTDPERQREVPTGTARTGATRHPAPDVHPHDTTGVPDRGTRPAGSGRTGGLPRDDDEGGSGRRAR